MPCSAPPLGSALPCPVQPCLPPPSHLPRQVIHYHSGLQYSPLPKPQAVSCSAISFQCNYPAACCHSLSNVIPYLALQPSEQSFLTAGLSSWDGSWGELFSELKILCKLERNPIAFNSVKILMPGINATPMPTVIQFSEDHCA